MKATRIIKARANGRPSPAAIRAAARVLRKGGLVVAPTDTVYGVAADPAVPGAAARLCAAKGRPADKPIPMLAASMKQASEFGAAFNEMELALASSFWPGPLTLVLKTGRKTEGIRVPAHPVMHALLLAMGRPLRVTSANRSGHPAPLTAAEAMAELGEAVELGLDDGPSPIGVPSTVAMVEGGRKIRILRRGALSASDLKAARPCSRPRACRGAGRKQ